MGDYSITSRLDFETYIAEAFSVTGEHPWDRYPSHQVFQHTGNKKRFALTMDIPKKNLEIADDGTISVVNLKCDTRLIGSFRMEPGIYPAWHMNKAHWITVALDGSVGDEKLKFLLDMSYELTKK